MHEWTDIRRRILVNGEAKRSVQHIYGIHRKTLDQILSHADIPGCRMTKKRPPWCHDGQSGGKKLYFELVRKKPLAIPPPQRAPATNR